MRKRNSLVLIFGVVLLLGCATPERRLYNEHREEVMDIVETQVNNPPNIVIGLLRASRRAYLSRREELSLKRGCGFWRKA